MFVSCLPTLRTDSLLDRNVYFLYDEDGKIISADDKLKKGLERDAQTNHDITYHYDQAGGLKGRNVFIMSLY